MADAKNVTFAFENQVSPRYIQPLFLQLEYGQWYESTELRELLRTGGLDVVGKKIVNINIIFWDKIGLGELQRQGPPKPNLFRLTPLGKQLADLYSTNQALFYDVMHFLFYSSWRRSQDIEQAPFWLYAQICDHLWQEAPSPMHSIMLTSQMQTESQQAFPEQNPSFPEQSVRSVFPWLTELDPSFLAHRDNSKEYWSERRSYCTPQLFHLAVDLIYGLDGLNYDTSLAMDDKQIAVICKVCMLDPDRFWDMASLADMAIRELEIRKGQWGTSLALTAPPRWIELPYHGAAAGGAL